MKTLFLSSFPSPSKSMPTISLLSPFAFVFPPLRFSPLPSLPSLLLPSYPNIALVRPFARHHRSASSGFPLRPSPSADVNLDCVPAPSKMAVWLFPVTCFRLPPFSR
ncbi:hypothetical protein FKM82_028008 [Ascaphus truei]